MIAENEQESRKDWLLHLFKYYAQFTKQNKEMMFWQKTSHRTGDPACGVILKQNDRAKT